MKPFKTQRHRRHFRIRKKISGTAQRPRLAVFRSLKHIYVQAIDDDKGATIASASTMLKELPGVEGELSSKQKAAKAVGLLIAQRLKEQGVDIAVFDRGGFLYHGRIAALADGVREGGVTV